ncbi:DUF4352 domain-containing protein [Streptococcus orisasini]|uniref:DUF4352 domain-containing protein n=1 Tax=Streptococcus orisasini TaxID=1080071 RepID=UPI00070CE71F|nr:DUF4352 domain-containing protein [Streptococcus orisasini]
MQKKTNVWKILGIVFSSLAGFFCLVTFILGTFYAVHQQEFAKWAAVNKMQDRTIANKKKEIKSLKRRIDSHSRYTYKDYSKDKTKRYIFGESAVLNTGEEITVTGIKTNANLKGKGLSKDNQTIVLNVSVKNTRNEPIQFSPKDFYIYDTNLDIADLSHYAANKKIPDVIEPGKTITASIYFTATKPAPYLVNFGNAYWLPQTVYQKRSRSI